VTLRCRRERRGALAGGDPCRLFGGERRGKAEQPLLERGAMVETEEPIVPTLTTTEHGEIHVDHRQVTRMADRLWRLGSPERRTAYVEKARRRLAAGPARHSDAAIVLAGNDEKAPS
jgi:hypothetical protein